VSKPCGGSGWARLDEPGIAHDGTVFAGGAVEAVEMSHEQGEREEASSFQGPALQAEQVEVVSEGDQVAEGDLKQSRVSRDAERGAGAGRRVVGVSAVGGDEVVGSGDGEDGDAVGCTGGDGDRTAPGDRRAAVGEGDGAGGVARSNGGRQQDARYPYTSVWCR